MLVAGLKRWCGSRRHLSFVIVRGTDASSSTTSPRRRRRHFPPEPAPATSVDPATAGPGDRLDNGLIVKRRLGRGGSADVLLVEREGSGEELVLKVALDDAHADRIRAEADVLRRLHHQNIVRFVAETMISGRPAILMERAGERRSLSGYAVATHSPSTSCVDLASIFCRPLSTSSRRASPIAT